MKDKNEKMLEQLKASAENLDIPESIRPEQMKKRIKQQEAQRLGEQKKRKRFYRKGFGIIAAGLCLVIGFNAMMDFWKPSRENEVQQQDANLDESRIGEVASADKGFPKVTYEDIYRSMEATWKKETLMFGEYSETEEGVRLESSAEALKEAPMADGTADSVISTGTVNDVNDDFATTNVQTEGVEEADIVKNDGRYLYQIVWNDANGKYQKEIQIIDTKDSLTEVSKVGGFQNIDEFYVWEDVLIIIENKYLYDEDAKIYTGLLDCYKAGYQVNCFHEISFYDLTDRSQPEKLKTFTLQGSYASSRISDGYFYGFSKYYANPGEGEQDYDAYIPTLDGARLQADCIYLGEENEETSYLVLVSIDLRNPTEFVQTAGIVTGADQYYVSKENIYVADTNYAAAEDGWNGDKTALLRFAYGDGKFLLGAKGEIKGTLENSFSLDEYNGYLRAVTTAWEYELETVKDDRTGEEIGTTLVDEKQSNGLYVLDENLQEVGKIEGLAENERIYSARFMGNIGYFVTFRQTDPLFTVDLTDPENPKILNELKVSGFSEYLHVYTDGRLLGIGMEADEETGRQEGMKLSMFDISDPTNVTEISKLPLEEYYYSEALYNHRAVMISTAKNLFGFAVEGSDTGEYWRHYLIFTYENEQFVQKMKIDTKDAEGRYDSVRGTFIGDVFYLLCGNGSVESYDLNTGDLLESLGP